MKILSVVILLCGAWISAAMASAPSTADVAALPHPPRRFVTDPPVSPGPVVRLSAGDNLQHALNEASPGETIVLEAGAVFHGPFILPEKRGHGWITIRTSAIGKNFPKPGQRASVADARLMPKLEADYRYVIMTAPGAHNYRFIGIEIRPGSHPGESKVASLLDRFRRRPVNLVIIRGDGEGLFPAHIVFDRCYLHGDPRDGTRRGILMNGRYVAVLNSTLIDFKRPYVDAQAIDGYGGPGPFRLDNNLFAASGEDVMFGGQDPTTYGLVPSDIVITRNHFTKPIRWRKEKNAAGHPRWSVKNLLELKNAQRVLISGNLFEYNWPSAQNGFSILFTPRNQDGTAPWSTVRDVTFKNNVVRHVAAGINIGGHDSNQRSRQTRRILIADNLFYDVGGRWDGGRLLQLVGGVDDVTFTRNTVFETGVLVVAGDTNPNHGFVFKDNIVQRNRYGIKGGDVGSGEPTLARYFRDADISGNVVIPSGGDRFLPGNFIVPRDDVGFVDYSHHDYRLRPDSRFSGRAGANYKILCSAMAASDRIKLCNKALQP